VACHACEGEDDWSVVAGEGEGEEDAKVVGSVVTFASMMVGACEDIDWLSDEGGRGVVTLLPNEDVVLSAAEEVVLCRGKSAGHSSPRTCCTPSF